MNMGKLVAIRYERYATAKQITQRKGEDSMKVILNGCEVYFDVCVNLMDDEIREALHAEGIETEQEFLDRYIEEHAKKYNGEVFTI